MFRPVRHFTSVTKRRSRADRLHATDRKERMKIELGVAGFAWADLFFRRRSSRSSTAYSIGSSKSAAHRGPRRFAVYRDCRGDGMTPEAQSDALLGAAPHSARSCASSSESSKTSRRFTPTWAVERSSGSSATSLRKSASSRRTTGKEWRERGHGHDLALATASSRLRSVRCTKGAARTRSSPSRRGRSGSSS